MAVMENCFTLIGAHQHSIAIGFKNGENFCFIDPLLPRRVQSTGEAPAPHNTCGSCWLGTAGQFSHGMRGEGGSGVTLIFEAVNLIRIVRASELQFGGAEFKSRSDC